MTISKDIKAVLFDFGGTLDLDGIHWYDLWSAAYKFCKLDIKESDFRSAYFYAEEILNSSPAFKKTYQELIFTKASYQMNYIYKDKYNTDPQFEHQAYLLSVFCYNAIKANTPKSIEVLSGLKDKYELGVISNFYGNLDIVLDELGMKQYIKTNIDSKVVDIRKPDPAIYKLAAERIGHSPENCIFIGDSYQQDIIPAKSVGYTTILLKNELVNKLDYDKADIIIRSISDLSQIL